MSAGLKVKNKRRLTISNDTHLEYKALGVIDNDEST